MSTLNDSINKIEAGSGSTIGTGMKGLAVRFKKAKKFLLTDQGYKYPGDQDYTDAYLASLVAKGDVIVLDNVADVEELTTQHSYEDIGGGVEVFDEEGLYAFKIKFIQGMHMDQILDSLSGSAAYDICAIDSSGKQIGTMAADGTSMKGYTLGVHQKEMLEGFLGKNTAREAFKIQLTQTSEVANYAIKDADDDFNGMNATGVNEVKLVLTVPSDTDTTVTVKATRKQDGAVFTGAAFGQWSIKINGTPANPTGGDDSTTAGTYVLTGVTAISTNDVVSVALYDVSASASGITVDGDVYKSATVQKTAVA